MFDLAYLEFCDWVAHYTGTPLMTVLAAALPAAVIQKTRREVLLLDRTAIDRQDLDPSEQRVLATLLTKKTNAPMTVRYLGQKSELPASRLNATLYRLKQKGIVDLQSTTIGQTARKTETWLRHQPDPTESLTPRQTTLWQSFLAHFPTGEAKQTEAMKTMATTSATLQKLVSLGALEKN